MYLKDRKGFIGGKEVGNKIEYIFFMKMLQINGDY